MDTLRNMTYVFGVMSETNDKNPFKDDIFMIVTYFVNKLMTVRTNSMQLKFQGLFKNDSGCQSFFNKINQYLKTYSTKISKGTLKQFFAKQKYTDELSPRSYYVDKNLEKQIIDFCRLLCKNGNNFMQDYMKKQFNNSRSFNLILLINDFTKEFLTHLHYPVAFDTFTTCLKCLLEFIQGPNMTNQNILILNDFVTDVAIKILAMKFHDKEKTEFDILPGFNDSQKDSMTIRRSKSAFPSMSIGKSSFSSKGSMTLTGESKVTLPATNYMISLGKYRVLLLLNHLTDGFEPSDYVFYLYRREISPDVFRLNLAYQQYFFAKGYGSEYTTNLFFTYYQNINQKDKTPFIVEIGFECYFLLKKMEENLKLDYDERYSIMKLMPKWDKPQIKINHNILVESVSFIADIFYALTHWCRKSAQDVVFGDIKKIQNSDHSIRSILLFYENHSAQIEILKGGELQEIWFPRLPYCSFRNSDAKDEFLENVNRTNAKTKCENLERSSKTLLVVLKIDYWLRTHLGRFFGLFIKYIELWKNYLQVLAVTINVLIIYSYSDELGDRMNKPSVGELNQTETEWLLRVLGILNVLLAFIVVGVQLALRIPYNIQRYKVREQDQKKRQKDADYAMRENTTYKAYNKLHGYYEALKMIVTDKLILYHTLYFIFTILGVTFHPFFFAFCLTYLIVRSAVLINVLKAVYEPRYQIILSLFLFFVVAYFFSIFSYMLFYDDYNDSLQNSCYSLWSCLVVTVDQSYKNDGAIGGFLPVPFTPGADKLSVSWGRFFYDYIFNLIVAILLVEILSGIIIDKFGELREENEEKLKDSMNE